MRNISEKTWVHSYPKMPQATVCLREDQTLARCHVCLFSGSAMHDVCVACAKKCAVAMGANVLKPMTHGSTSCNICCSTNVEQCCTDVLKGIQLVSIFVRHRSTTFKYSKPFEACLQRIWTRLVNRSLEPRYGEKKSMNGWPTVSKFVVRKSQRILNIWIFSAVSQQWIFAGPWNLGQRKVNLSVWPSPEFERDWCYRPDVR